MATKNSSKNSANPRLSGEYWKIAETEDQRGCVFCDLKEKYIITRKAGIVLTANLYPYVDGQLIVIPERHVEEYSKLKDKEVIAAHKMQKLAIKLLKDTLGIDDIWLIIRDGKKSGKTVRHLHWNVMPYTEKLNTWHYQDISLPAQKLAQKLRKKL